MTAPSDLVAIARATALHFGLDADLVCGLIERESSWNTYATRYEPAFYERYIVPMNLPEDEGKARATSWGLCQIMLQVARELGYTDTGLNLLNPETGIYWGCKKLQKCLQQTSGDVEVALLRYNGGGNEQYPLEVIGLSEKYKGANA